MTLPSFRFRPVLLASLCFVTAASAAVPFYLKDGDRVVFYGDSITDWRIYTNYIETFVATRFPELDVTFTNSGWGGDTVRGGAGGDIDTRLERDVLAHDPTVVTIMLGMNDGARRAPDPHLHQLYRDGLVSIIRKLRMRAPAVRLTLLRPSPYDDITRAPDFPGGYNQTLVRYGETVSEVAALASREAPVTVADLNAPVVAMLRKAYAADPVLAKKIIPDRVHPRNGGHLIMASALLKAWHAPATVSSVDIDARARTMQRAENTRVENLVFPASAASAITWTQLDAALPMPIDTTNAELMLAVRSSDFNETLNRQMLRVTGLESPARLGIDGVEIGVFTPEQLAAGVNLATLDTPMSEQAARVHQLTVDRVRLRHVRWRTFEVPYAAAAGSGSAARAAYSSVLGNLDAAAASVAALRRTLAQPVPRRYELAPLPATAPRPGIPATGIPNEGTSIQPHLSSRYGNSIELPPGSGIVFDEGLDRREFVALLYAANAEREDIVNWRAGDPDHRPLALGNPKWNGQSSVTWKFTAPPGRKFSGGILSMEAATIWKDAGLVLRAHSDYADSPGGMGGCSPQVGTIYSTDDRRGDAPWQWTKWSVAIPQGVSEFYLTLTKEQPWVGAWVNNLRAESVSFKNR